MGGNATLQMKLLHDKGIFEEIRNSSAIVLGVSAGSMNMGKETIDIYESSIPYEGLGFANITVKAHYPSIDDAIMDMLKKVSMNIPICLMANESAIFVDKKGASYLGEVYSLINGCIEPISDEQLHRIGKGLDIML